MKKEFLYLLGGLFVVGLVLYLISPVSHKDKTVQEDTTSEEEVTSTIQVTQAAEKNIPESSVPAATRPVVTTTENQPVINPAIQRAFSQNLRALGSCLQTQNNVPGDELEPSLQTLVDSVRGEWGESVISTEDWMQVDMVTPEGEKRRLRVEMDFDSDSQVQRKLKYSTVDQAGQTIPISIPEDQTIEPSESLIASLESGNKILTKEKFERVYFQNGEEIVAKQNNGILVDIEINKGARTFKCTNLNVETGTCQCVQ